MNMNLTKKLLVGALFISAVTLVILTIGNVSDLCAG
jgi:hypothetical protein